MKIDSSIARLLTDVGMMAAWHGDTIDARTILEGLQVFREDSPVLQIGQAVAYMNEGRYESAVHVLEDALEKDKQSDVTLFNLALAYQQCGYNTRSRSLCEEIISANRDATTVELAKMLLSIPVSGVGSQSTPVQAG